MPGPVDTVRDLAALMAEHGLARLSVADGSGLKVELVRAQAFLASQPEEVPAVDAPSEEEILFASAGDA